MEQTVFISHSSQDAAIASKLVAELEKAGIQCWIAPRNIQPGLSYAAAIIEGIRKCTTFIFVFSKASNDSEAVVNEIENAQALKKLIIPVKLDDVEYSDSLEYYLRSKHFINAFDKSLSEATKEVMAIFSQDNNSQAAFVQKDRPATTSTAATAGRSKRKSTWVIAISLCILLIVVFDYLLNKDGGPPQNNLNDGKQGSSSSARDTSTKTQEKIIVSATSKPYSIKAAGRTEINVFAYTESKNPVASAQVLIQAGGGYFDNSKGVTEIGTTNEKGVFTTGWTAPDPVAAGYGLSVRVSKDGYIEGTTSLRIMTSN